MATPAPALRTRLCALLGVEHPVVQAGTGAGLTTPALMAAASGAGALGVLGAHLMPPDRLRSAVREIEARIVRPFGANFIVARPEPGSRDIASAQQALDCLRVELGLPPGSTEPAPPFSLRDRFAVVFEEGVPVLSLGLGDPSPFVAPAHDQGMRVVAMVATVAEAVRAAEAGADALASQGVRHRASFAVPTDGEPPMVGTLALCHRWLTRWGCRCWRRAG